jgi:hypothetical protein
VRAEAVGRRDCELELLERPLRVAGERFDTRELVLQNGSVVLFERRFEDRACGVVVTRGDVRQRGEEILPVGDLVDARLAADRER